MTNTTLNNISNILMNFSKNARLNYLFNLSIHLLVYYIDLLSKCTRKIFRTVIIA
jgi:hypothetical protein